MGIIFWDGGDASAVAEAGRKGRDAGRRRGKRSKGRVCAISTRIEKGQKSDGRV